MGSSLVSCISLRLFRSACLFPVCRQTGRGKTVCLFHNKTGGSAAAVLHRSRNGIFRLFFPGKQNLYSDWANFLIYGFFFYYGYLIAENPELLDRISRCEKKLAAIAACAFIVYLILNAVEVYSLRSAVEESYPYAVLKAFFQGIAEYSWVMLILGFARNHMNADGKIRRYLSSSSFALYLFHYPLLSYVMYVFIGTHRNHALLFVLGIVTTYVLFFACYELFIRRIGIFRALCGIKQIS